MKCPICKKPTRLGSEYAPFCSNRCQLIDLGKWSSEEYVITSPLQPEIDGHGANGRQTRDSADAADGE